MQLRSGLYFDFCGEKVLVYFRRPLVPRADEDVRARAPVMLFDQLGESPGMG